MVVQILEYTDRGINAQLKGKAINNNTPQFSDNSDRGIQFQNSINSLQISDQLNSEIVGINDPENSGVLRTLLSTAQKEVNPIYVLSKPTNSNQVGEATTTNPNPNILFSNPKSREESEVARVTKKKKRHVD